MNTTTVYSMRDEYVPKKGDVFHHKGNYEFTYMIFEVDAEARCLKAIRFSDGQACAFSFQSLMMEHTIYRDVAISIEGDEV